MRLLVTGAAGFIGSNFVRYWLEQRPDDHVVAYDLLTYAGVRENVPERVPFVQGDIADLELAEQTLAEHDLDVVVNFAAESHNSLAVQDPALFARTNVLGTQQLLEASRRHGVTRFHHISTCEVYGDLALDSDEAFSEESPYRPRTPYNASKAAADHYVRSYFETFELPTTITNCSNNYGPFQFPEKVIPLFTTHALDDLALPLYASTQNKREWLHVHDHCRAIELVLEQGRARRDVQRGLRRRALDRGGRRCRARAHGEGRVAQDHRPRPAGARPALPARLVEAPRARLVGRDRLGRGDRADRALVRGEPRLVGASARPSPGRRSRVALKAPEAVAQALAPMR